MSLRIAIIIDDFFPASGGIGRSGATGRTEELTALGHDVTLIAPDRHLQKPRIGRIIECPTLYVEGLPAHLSVLHCRSPACPAHQRCRPFRHRPQPDRTRRARARLEAGAAAGDPAPAQLPRQHRRHPPECARPAVWGTLSYLLLVLPALRRARKVDGVATRFPSRRRRGRWALRQDGLAPLC